MKRLASLLAVAASTAAITGAATLGTADGLASSACPPAGAKPIAADSAGLVYSLNDAVYTCSGYTGRIIKLGSSGLAGPGATTVGPLALAGQYVVYGTHMMGVDNGSSEVLLRRLSTGRVISSASAFPTMLGPESNTTIEAVVLRPSGAFAWTVSGESIIRPNDSNIGVYEANMHPGRSDFKLLDQGRRIAPTSLKLHGAQLSWKHGSTTRHATLN
jgi:hypothetical protein